MKADTVTILLYVAGALGLLYFIDCLIQDSRHGRKGGQTSRSSPQKPAPHQREYITVDGPSGSRIHIDENGNYAGESVPGLFGDTMIHVDADGRYAGSSVPGLFDGQMIHTDAEGNYAGQSNRGICGTTVHSGKNGVTGVTTDGPLGTHVTVIDQNDE